MLCAKFGWICPSSAEEEDENVNNATNKDVDIDDDAFKHWTNFDHKNDITLVLSQNKIQCSDA